MSDHTGSRRIYAEYGSLLPRRVKKWDCRLAGVSAYLGRIAIALSGAPLPPFATLSLPPIPRQLLIIELLKTFTEDRFRHTAMNNAPHHNSYLLLFAFYSPTIAGG